MPNTLYLDIDTSFVAFHPEKIPASTKLILPIINEHSNIYKTDLYAVLSLNSVDIDVLVIDNYVQITADYLDAVPYYYLGFTTNENILDSEKYKMGVNYLTDQFNMTSSVMLAFAHFLFQHQTDPLSNMSESSEQELSNNLMLLNKNMMMFPNIQALDPRTAYLYALTKPEYRGRTHLPFFFKTVRSEYEALCQRILENIDAGRPILNEIKKTMSFETKFYSNQYFNTPFTFDDYYLVAISIYEFRKKINNNFLKDLIENITGYEEDDVSRPLQPDSKEDLLQLKNWICQLLNTDYKNGFIYLWKLPKLYTFDIDDESKKFPYLGKCEVLSGVNPKDVKGISVLCDNGIIDFYKKFNKSYFA
jgi:hypothetical protein